MGPGCEKTGINWVKYNITTHKSFAFCGKQIFRAFKFITRRMRWENLVIGAGIAGKTFSKWKQLRTEMRQPELKFEESNQGSKRLAVKSFYECQGICFEFLSVDDEHAHKTKAYTIASAIVYRCMTTKYIFVFILERTHNVRAFVQLMTMSVERIARETVGKNQFRGKRLRFVRIWSFSRMCFCVR